VKIYVTAVEVVKKKEKDRVMKLRKPSKLVVF
jgi:hypothetical protein